VLVRLQPAVGVDPGPAEGVAAAAGLGVQGDVAEDVEAVLVERVADVAK
jgi:hypothetical protein